MMTLYSEVAQDDVNSKLKIRAEGGRPLTAKYPDGICEVPIKTTST